MTPRKVAIVGMGGVFPGSTSLQDFCQKLFSDKSFIREWPEVTPYGKKIRSKVSGYITESEVGLEVVPSTLLENYPETYVDTFDRIPPKHLATADLGSIWAMLSAQDAIAMAGWSTTEVRSEGTGVIVGSGGAGNTVLRSCWNNFFEHGKKTLFLGPHNVDRSMIYRDAANVSCLIGNRGVTEAIGSACACGLGNIGYGARLIQFGIQDRVIAGGTEGTSIETFISFDSMQVLSTHFGPGDSSRTFDKDRDGFVCSFGCGIVALEALEIAQARGAHIIAVIDSYFNNSDGDGDMFSPSFDGQLRLWKGLERGMDTALKPDVVKVHGTSTPKGDIIELLSVAEVLGTTGYHISAPKSQFGHLLGAAGSVEFIVALLMLQEQRVSPCLNSTNLSETPEDFQLAADWKGSRLPPLAYRDIIPQAAFKKEIRQVVCLNYGFGGTNSAISISLPT